MNDSDNKNNGEELKEEDLGAVAGGFHELDLDGLSVTCPSCGTPGSVERLLANYTCPICKKVTYFAW